MLRICWFWIGWLRPVSVLASERYQDTARAFTDGELQKGKSEHFTPILLGQDAPGADAVDSLAVLLRGIRLDRPTTI